MEKYPNVPSHQPAPVSSNRCNWNSPIVIIKTSIFRCPLPRYQRPDSRHRGLLQGLRNMTLWLWLTVCHGKSPFVIGKPSISIRAMASMAMLNNQRVLWCVMIMVILWYNYYDIMVILYYYWFWSIMIMQNGIMIYYDNPWDWDTLVNQVEWNGIGMET